MHWPAIADKQMLTEKADSAKKLEEFYAGIEERYLAKHRAWISETSLARFWAANSLS